MSLLFEIPMWKGPARGMGRASLCEDLWLDSMRVIYRSRPKMAWAVDEDMIDDLTASVRTIVHRYCMVKP